MASVEEPAISANRWCFVSGEQVAELSSQVEGLRAENAAAKEQLDRVKELTAVEMNKRSQLIERAGADGEAGGARAACG